ncbi:hypothetical protein QUB10_27085 [Microcoleus sp. B5-D4]|uniref:hypothetical protein n=1 Tax=unclassified Microcoleus TaxID=2642155 RepID=UPI002FD07B93
MKFQIPLTPGAVTQFLIRVVTSLALLSVLSQMSLYFLPNAKLADFFTKAFNLDAEKNIPTLYSCLALLFSSLLLGVIAYAKNLDSDYYKKHWKILSFIFLFLSLDEAGSLHEKLIDPLRGLLNATGVFYFTWIVPFGFLVVIFLFSYSKFVLHLPVSTKKLFVAACALYIGGAIGMEMVGGYISSTMGEWGLSYKIVVNIEESLEMLGIVVFIHALTSYIKTYLGGVSWNIYIPGKNQPVTDDQNIGLPALSEAANTNLLR